MSQLQLCRSKSRTRISSSQLCIKVGRACDNSSCCRRKKMQGCRRNLGILLLSVVLAILVRFPHNALAQECELNCKTNNCSPEGICICDTPTQDSIMSGDRQFEGGVFCGTPSVMCDGTNSFWCESGGTCNELVQGENYTCTCPLGFAGEHCNLAGELCVDIYCYNAGICQIDLAGRGSCDCNPEYRGSADCSLLTPISAPSRPAPVVTTHSKHDRSEWWWASAVVATILVVSCVAGLAVKWHRRRVSKLSQTRFQELQHVQMNDGPDFYDDGDDDPFRDHKNTREKAFP